MENNTGTSRHAVASAHTSLRMTFINSNIACCGARCLSELSLTDPSLLPFTAISKDRSKIIQKSLDLCGIAAIGEILKFFGGLCLILSHRTRRTHLSFSRLIALALQALAASLD